MDFQRYGLVLVSLAITGILLAVPAMAAVIVSPSGGDDTTAISNAIIAAGSGDGIVILTQGTFHAHDITTSNSVTIRADTASGGTAANTIIDAQGNGRLFGVGTGTIFTLDNITLMNGRTDIGGGAILSAGADVRIISSSFVNCVASGPSGYGGAILTGGGSPGSDRLSITSSSFTNCQAESVGVYYGGGAIYSYDSQIDITSTSFTSCGATGVPSYGGAIYAYTDTITITSSSFKDCTAGVGGAGGVVSAEAGSFVTIRFSRISGTGNQVNNDGTSTVTAADNWWGTNAGPAPYVSGITVPATWLVLGIAADPSAITTAQTSDVRANLTYRNTGSNTAGGGIFVPDTVPATFAVMSGTGGVEPSGSFFSSGTAATTFTQSAAGTSTVSATVDGETVYTGISVTAAVPVITGISPSSGPEAGGTQVNITGTSLAGASVTFGSNAATINTNTATAINMTTPAGTGTVTVTVTTAGGTATTSYEYVEPPEITDISPASGPAAGGTLVNITGSGLEDTTSVTFGSAAALISANTDTAINTTAPAGSGTVTVTVTTAGGSDTISYTYIAAPAVASVSPATGPEAGGIPVTVTGTDFTGATAVTFGGTAATGFTVETDTTITATSPAGTGTVDIIVTTPGGTSATSGADQFTYYPVPAIMSVSPGAGPTTGGTSVTITGTGFTGATGVTFGGTAATGVSVVSPTTITATAPAHAAGTVDVVVTTPGGTSATGADDQYTYLAAPEVTSVSPSSGPQTGGDTVTVTGTGFTGATAVSFGGTAATSFSVTSPASITATSPAGTGTVDITVTTPGGTSATSSADRYTYVAAPAVTSVSPTDGPEAGGTMVTLTGTGFTGASAVSFGGSPAASFTVISDTTITATSPAGTGIVDITVTTPGGTSLSSAADQFTYIPAPAVTSVSPESGPTAGGTSVTISGTGFTGASAVTFGAAAAASFTVNSDSSITATSPAGTGTVDVRVTTPGGTSPASAADGYTYAPLPAVTALSPTAGPLAGGTTVAITGTGFTGATAVDFGVAPATAFTVNSDSSITATSPAGTGTVDVRVTTPGGTSTTSAADQYTYLATPGVTSVSPTAGPAAGATSVTITGTGFTGATAVTFGGTAATGFTADSDTSITATSPAGTGTVDVTVTTPGGTSTTSPADRFTYIPAPAVTSVAPSSGPAAGGDTVTITGTGFVTGATVTFGGTAATGVTVDSATSITATTPAHAAGAVDVVVTNPDTQAGTLTNGFTYFAAPTVTGILPAGGTTAGGTSVTITGTGFIAGATVSFGGSPGTGVTVVGPTSLTVTTPAHAAGVVDVVVMNVDSQYGTLTNGYTYTTPPVTPTPTTAPVHTTAPPYSPQDNGETLSDFPASSATTAAAQSDTILPMTVTVNIGGDSKAWQAVVTGTNLRDLIVTGTEQHGSFGNCNPPAGSVFQYLGLEPARYGTITDALISFTVPQAWLEENHIDPKSIVLYHMTTDCWQGLPTTFLYEKDGTVYFSGRSSGFSSFAIAGTPAMPASVTAAATQEIVSTPEPQQTPAPAAVAKEPVTTQTTAPPAAPAQAPAKSSPFPLVPVLAVICCAMLVASGWYARRWWIRRQNPALFEEY